MKLLHLFRLFCLFFSPFDLPTCVRYAKMFGFCTSSVNSIRKYMFQNCAVICGFCRGKSIKFGIPPLTNIGKLNCSNNETDTNLNNIS